MIVLVDTNKAPNPTSEYDTIGEVSDGYHTFDELYNIRMLYNAAFFNELAKDNKYNVHKSKKHSDGEECFGGGWFIVMATLPTGQICNHYKLEDWDLFHCEERDCADICDGHDAKAGAKRLKAFVGNIQRVDNYGDIGCSDSAMTAAKDKPFNTNGHEYVDLGLPSGTLWAKCNVGASKESGYGGYYQWGGIEDFADKEKRCEWGSYPHGGNFNKLTKYNTDEELGTVDNKTVLDLSDDVAHQVMGGDWHMPTKEQLQELIDNTTSEWTTVDGINGRRFTSKFNGNSIFIPAAGWRAGRSLNSAGYNCYLWSSSLYQSSPSNAYYLYFSSGICDIYTNRSCGLSVRGVLH